MCLQTAYLSEILIDLPGFGLLGSRLTLEITPRFNRLFVAAVTDSCPTLRRVFDACSAEYVDPGAPNTIYKPVPLSSKDTNITIIVYTLTALSATLTCSPRSSNTVGTSGTSANIASFCMSFSRPSSLMAFHMKSHEGPWSGLSATLHSARRSSTEQGKVYELVMDGTNPTRLHA
jgi:hypothetical protein